MDAERLERAARALLDAVDGLGRKACDEPECAGLCVTEAADALRAALAAQPAQAWRDSFPPTHHCRECTALWRRWPDGSWSLVTMTCGKCCDNVPMGEQIVPLAAPEPVQPKWLLVKTGHYGEKGEVHSIAFFDQHDDGMGPSPYVLGDFPCAEAAAIVDELNRCGADPAALAKIRNGGTPGALPRPLLPPVPAADAERAFVERVAAIDPKDAAVEGLFLVSRFKNEAKALLAARQRKEAP